MHLIFKIGWSFCCRNWNNWINISFYQHIIYYLNHANYNIKFICTRSLWNFSSIEVIKFTIYDLVKYYCVDKTIVHFTDPHKDKFDRLSINPFLLSKTRIYEGCMTNSRTLHLVKTLEDQHVWQLYTYM